MNLEVVRLRARPGGDAGAVATFAAGAIAGHEATVALVGALVALGRVPRVGETDVGAVVAAVGAVFAPILAQRGVALTVDVPDAAVRSAAGAHAVRLAVGLTLETAARDAEAGRASRPVGPGVAAAGEPDGPPRALRCTLHSSDRPTLVVTPAPSAWPDDARAALAGAGVHATPGPEGLLVTFPPA